MPALTEAEIAQRGVRMAKLQGRLINERKEWKDQSADHRELVKELTDELDTLSREIATGQAVAVQQALPDPGDEPDVQVGSGPDNPSEITNEQLAAALDALRDGPDEPLPEGPYRAGWNGQRMGDRLDENPHPPEEQAQEYKAWSTGWKAAADAAAHAEEGDPAAPEYPAEYREGYEAFDNDAPRDDNPYTGAGEDEAIKRAAWSEGWDAGEEDAENEGAEGPAQGGEK